MRDNHVDMHSSDTNVGEGLSDACDDPMSDCDITVAIRGNVNLSTAETGIG